MDQSGDECSFGVWLADAAEQHPDIADLHGDICNWLLTAGLSISRSSLGIETLHPQLTGSQVVWTSSETQVVEAERGDDSTTDYLASPARIVDENERAVPAPPP